MSARDRVIILDPDEQQLVVGSLYNLRKELLKIDSHVEDVDDVLMKIIDAPTKKEKRRLGRESR